MKDNKFIDILIEDRAQMAAQTTTFLFLSQVVKLLPAGCQAAATTGAECSFNTVSVLDGSSTFHM